MFQYFANKWKRFQPTLWTILFSFDIYLLLHIFTWGETSSIPTIDFYLAFIVPLFLPIVFSIGYAWITASRRWWGQMGMTFLFTVLSVSFVSIVYTAVIFDACFHQLPAALGCDSDPFPLMGLPMLFGFIGIVSTVFISPVISLIVRSVYKLGSLAFVRNILEKMKIATKHWLVVKVAVLGAFILLFGAFSWHRAQWETHFSARTKIRLSYPDQMGLLYSHSYWNVSDIGVDNIWFTGASQITSGLKGASVSVYPIEKMSFKNGAILRVLFPSVHTEGSGFDKMELADIQTLNMIEKFLQDKPYFHGQRELIWKGNTAHEFRYSSDSFNNLECALLYTEREKMYLIRACWPANDSKTKRQVDGIVNSLELP